MRNGQFGKGGTTGASRCSDPVESGLDLAVIEIGAALENVRQRGTERPGYRSEELGAQSALFNRLAARSRQINARIG
jgi:hypothetical protein